MSLDVTQDDADRSEAARAEIKTVIESAAKVGATVVVDSLPGFAGLTDPQKAGLLNIAEAIAIALIRLQFNGTTVFPVRLPNYTVASVPSATGVYGQLVYVSNGAAGLPIIAFSDGTNWRRSDTRGVISAT